MHDAAVDPCGASGLKGQGPATEDAMTRGSTTIITPILVADLHVEGERMPIYVHLIDNTTRGCSSTPA